jgi:hypothetical protein
MALVEVGECIFDAEQLRLSHGYEGLDPVGQEAFVNHIHFSGADREAVAARVIESWIAEMRARWPGRTFRVYRHLGANEVIIRFHVVRAGVPNWCEGGVGVITV